RFHEPLGVSICYEGILSSAVAESIDLGARWHVNLTEDLWYGDGFEPEQHLQLQRSRAIESGLLWLRCANAGISAAIDPGIQGQRVVRSHRKWQDGNWSSWVESTDAGETRLSAVGERAILQLIIDTPGPPTGQAALSRAAHWTGLIWLLAVFWHFWHRREKRPRGA
ncbi:MAG: nitrilase-related carbon-nitrogen hydrolase, partial [Planctomycetota bacterium]